MWFHIAGTAGGVWLLGQMAEPVALDLIETGTEPDYVATKIARYEPLSNGWVRIYYCSSRGKGSARVEFSVCCSLEDLVSMAREEMKISANVHNRKMLALGRVDLN